jgi:hypothetical protein
MPLFAYSFSWSSPTELVAMLAERQIRGLASSSAIDMPTTGINNRRRLPLDGARGHKASR